jgi:hypothetical protein
MVPELSTVRLMHIGPFFTALRSRENHMTNWNRHARRLIVVASALAMGSWLAFGGWPGSPVHTKTDTTRRVLDGGTLPQQNATMPALKIAEHGRLTLDAGTLPVRGSLKLALDLPDEARASGDQRVRIVSVDGRRVESTAKSLPGAGTGVEMEIDTAFLSRGLYMIEIDTAENHPLQIRRYVLELK